MRVAASRKRLARLLDLVDREDEHLLAVRERLLAGDCAVSLDRVLGILASDIGIDRLESFGAKFGRMQDTIMDKLVPAFLTCAGESTGPAIDNLARLEKLGLIEQADDWLQMRHLRNRLVHEYIEKPDDLAPALQRACRFTDRMHDDYRNLRTYARDRLVVVRSGEAADDSGG
ncbi:hypothetical protein [Thioalkalivibrio paradoxus]|uniref:DUF86 domain-containing protein n=1 Tax=Thioalkalivibrio paradoxus ARh 1 TaxID=713585 RepID=W0DKB1_9GAMM|nr:hypothetical protein [Thioalkalivibrio paradoxus]AHE97438.1 hypothetical protein THITH_03190 [Thioalkalivibrio paradoxus ARh 1]